MLALLLALCASTGVCEPAMVDSLDHLSSHVIYIEPTRYHGMGSDVEQWRSLVAEHFADVELALCVMRYESGGNPSAASPTDDHGLFQIHYPIWGPAFGVSRADLYNPVTNVILAQRIWELQGWQAWSAYRRGRCG